MINRPVQDMDVCSAYTTPTYRAPTLEEIEARRERNKPYLKYEGRGVFTPINPGMAWEIHQQCLADRLVGEWHEVYRMRHLRRKMLKAQPRGRAFHRVVTNEIRPLTMYNPV